MSTAHQPIPYPWVIQEFLPCGTSQIYGSTNHAPIWRSQHDAQSFANYCIQQLPCIYRKPVPIPITGTL